MSVNVYADVFKHQRKVSLNVECAKWRVKSEIISSQCKVIIKKFHFSLFTLHIIKKTAVLYKNSA